MTRWPTFSPTAETTTPPQTSGLSAPRPSPPGPTSPASPWLHNHAYRRASLSPSRLPSICNAKLTVPRRLLIKSGDLRRAHGKGRDAAEMVTRHRLIAARRRPWLVLDPVDCVTVRNETANRSRGTSTGEVAAIRIVRWRRSRVLRRDGPRGQRSPLGRLLSRLLDGEVA